MVVLLPACVLALSRLQLDACMQVAASKLAVAFSEEHNATLLHPFDDLDVIYGQGTIAVECVQQVSGCFALACERCVVTSGGGKEVVVELSLTPTPTLTHSCFTLPFYLLFFLLAGERLRSFCHRSPVYVLWRGRNDCGHRYRYPSPAPGRRRLRR